MFAILGNERSDLPAPTIEILISFLILKTFIFFFSKNLNYPTPFILQVINLKKSSILIFSWENVRDCIQSLNQKLV